jgi:hypothetical protein
LEDKQATAPAREALLDRLGMTFKGAAPLVISWAGAPRFRCTAAPVFRLTMEDLTALVPFLQEAAAELAVRLPLR